MPDIITVAKVVGSAGTIIAAVIAVAVWLRPVRIEPGYRLVFDGSGPDEITAIVTNKSNKPLYIVECGARGTYSWRHILWHHLRQPLMPPRLYRAARFRGPTHDLLSAPMKLSPQQPVTLRHRLLWDHFLAKHQTPFFLVEVKLSSGRTFRSNKLGVPGRWKLKHAVKQ